jgi:hypothetical protein
MIAEADGNKQKSTKPADDEAVKKKLQELEAEYVFPKKVGLPNRS